MDINKIIDVYHVKKKTGSDYAVIRKALKENENLNENEIKAVVAEIDRRITEDDRIAVEYRKIKIYRIVGWLLMLLGGLLTIAIYFRWVNAKGYMAVSYLPVVAGYLFIVAARRMQRKL